MSAAPSQAPVDRLLALEAGPDLLDHWIASGDGAASAEARPGRDAGSPAFDTLTRTLLAHTRVNPGQTLDAADHVLTAMGTSLVAGERAILRRLQGHCHSGLGRIADATAAYEAAFDAFLTAGRRHDAGRTTIGWVHALTLGGDPDAAARVATSGRRLLPRSDRVSRARLDTNLAGARLLAGRLEPAAGRFRAARETFADLGLPWDAAMCDHNLGMIAIMTADAPRAARHFAAALPGFRAAGLVQLELYAETGLATARIIAGDWEAGIARLTDLGPRFEELGDRRARTWLHRELATLFASLGAIEVALPEAIRAADGFAALDLHADAALATLLCGRLHAATGDLVTARMRLTHAREHFVRVGDVRAADRVGLELARVAFLAGDPVAAARGLPALTRRLAAHDPHGDGARARAILAETDLARRRLDPAGRGAREAYRDATRYPAVLERPGLALLVARTLAAGGDRRGALRWARRALDELEESLSTVGSRIRRIETGAARAPLYSQVVDLVLDLGGPRAPGVALDLLTRGRSAAVLEDVRAGRADPVRTGLRAAIGKLRDEALSGAATDASRTERMSGRIDALRRQLARSGRRAPATLRAVLRERSSGAWRDRVGDREVVVFDRGHAGWRAFVVRPGGSVDVVPLPDLEATHERAWIPFRLALDAAAGLDRDRRPAFLARTATEAAAALVALRDALLTPLDLRSDRVTVIPTGVLHALPLEALGDATGTVVTRLPHPALLRPARRARRTRRGSALLLHGGGDDARREVATVGRSLRRAGLPVRTGSRRRDLERSDPLAVLHVAAHGTFQREGWLLSGLELADGWMGFEQLDPARLRGALLHFTSCESGLTERMPGSDVDGWIVAGLAAGARELILTAWKIDDDAALRFSRAFYAAWTDGASAGEAAHRARAAVRAARPHPYAWAPFIAVE